MKFKAQKWKEEKTIRFKKKGDLIFNPEKALETTQVYFDQKWFKDKLAVDVENVEIEPSPNNKYIALLFG
jgi:hypothetical protein